MPCRTFRMGVSTGQSLRSGGRLAIAQPCWQGRADMAHTASPQPVTINPAPALVGRIRVPGDKSISHRSLMLAALAVGESRVEGLLEGEDVLATAAAMRAMGA